MSTKDLKDIPVLATKDLVVFPNTSIPLAVASSANKINVKAASEEEKLIYIVPLKDGKHPKSFKIKDLYQTGTLCRIEQIKQQASGAYQLMLTSLKRISFENFSKDAEGCIHPDEIKFVLRQLPSELEPEEIQEMIDIVDKNNDGKISYSEFRVHQHL